MWLKDDIAFGTAIVAATAIVDVGYCHGSHTLIFDLRPVKSAYSRLTFSS